MKIILLGYMASGKTTIGKQLSKKIATPFYDLDCLIEEKEGKAISKIFETKGEIYFRKVENKYLKEFLSEKDSYVLSLGGGTPCYAGNMDIICQENEVISIYLQASISTLRNRLNKNKSERPLVSSLSEKKLTEFIAKHIFERKNFYELANNTIKIDNKSIDTIVAEIRILLH